MLYLLKGMIFFLVPLTSFAQTRDSIPVYFDFDRFALTKKAKNRIDSFYRANKESIGSSSFVLNGYCDNRGSGRYNFKLSDQRVASIKKYIVKLGMNSGLLVAATGYGETMPLNENKTDEERQLNRRVDIIYIKNAKETQSPEITLKQKIEDTAMKAGTNIVLRNINFVGGRHHPLPESKPMLDELLDAMKNLPKLVIEIQGHICCQPDAGDGTDLETGFLNLSEARAKTIADWLIRKGIDANRVSYKGFGHANPLYSYPEQTEYERIQNRRVEIKIISK